MAHHKSAKKRIRISAKANERNRRYRAQVRVSIRRVREATEPQALSEALKHACSTLDRVAGKGIMHANTVARRKAMLHRLAARAGSQPQG